MDSSQEASKRAPAQEQQIEKPLIIMIGKATYIPRYESSIPRTVTEAILQREQTPKELPALGSSTIEDFVMEQLKAGVADPDTIAAAFVDQDVAGKVGAFVDRVRQTSEGINWEETFTQEHARAAQAKVITEMEAMGMTPDQIASVAGMGLGVAEGVGVSFFSKHAVSVSRLQAVRKALDYQAVFGTEMPLEAIVRGLMTHTTAHELGHVVDKAAGIATNNIPTEETWRVNGRTEENKGERFAEYWGYVSIEDQPELVAMRRREWGLQVAKVAQVWNTAAAYNTEHEQRADIGGIFRAINNRIGKGDDITPSLFLARRALYGGNEVESYAASYPREVVAQAVQPRAT